MSKCKGLAKSYCVIVKVNQRYKTAVNSIRVSRQPIINLEANEKWLNMFIGNSDLNQIIHAQRIRL